MWPGLSRVYIGRLSFLNTINLFRKRKWMPDVRCSIIIKENIWVKLFLTKASWFSGCILVQMVFLFGRKGVLALPMGVMNETVGSEGSELLLYKGRGFISWHNVMLVVSFSSHKEMENVVFSKTIMKHEEQIIKPGSQTKCKSMDCDEKFPKIQKK